MDLIEQFKKLKFSNFDITDLNKTKLAIFDVDGTLIKGESPSLFLKFLFFKGKLIKLGIFKLSFLAFLYRIGFIKDATELIENFAKLFKGQNLEDIKKLSIEFFNKILKKKIRRKLMFQIFEFKKQGYFILILSATPEFILKPLADFLGADKLISTKFEVKNGIFTGKIEKKIVYSNVKEEIVKHIEEYGFNLKQSIFFSDHISDLPLLEEVGFPIVVNPKSKLKKIALKKNWTILKL